MGEITCYCSMKNTSTSRTFAAIENILWHTEREKQAKQSALKKQKQLEYGLLNDKWSKYNVLFENQRGVN